MYQTAHRDELFESFPKKGKKKKKTLFSSSMMLARTKDLPSNERKGQRESSGVSCIF